MAKITIKSSGQVIERPAITNADPFIIVFQQRAPLREGYRRDHWANWRKFSAWPILFNSLEECLEFMDECFTFKNMKGRKLSASATRRSQLRRNIRGVK